MVREKWLITGGAGYIGTHIADLFIADGKDVVLLDSLYQGLSSRVDYLRKKHNTDIPLEVVDIRDYTAIENILEGNNFEEPYGEIGAVGPSSRHGFMEFGLP